MTYLYIFIVLAVIISFIADRSKTIKAFKVGTKKLWKITPSFLSILISVSIVLFLVPNEMIIKYLGTDNSFFAVILASIVGSVTVMPGPISYPLCGILVDEGVSYSVVAAFSSSLMLVGVLSYPIEKFYFGKKFAIWRNLICFVIALIIASVFSLINYNLL